MTDEGLFITYLPTYLTAAAAWREMCDAIEQVYLW